jgi:hypothetical protein
MKMLKNGFRIRQEHFKRTVLASVRFLFLPNKCGLITVDSKHHGTAFGYLNVTDGI